MVFYHLSWFLKQQSWRLLAIRRYFTYGIEKFHIHYEQMWSCKIWLCIQRRNRRVYQRHISWFLEHQGSPRLPRVRQKTYPESARLTGKLHIKQQYNPKWNAQSIRKPHTYGRWQIYSVTWIAVSRRPLLSSRQDQSADIDKLQESFEPIQFYILVDGRINHSRTSGLWLSRSSRRLGRCYWNHNDCIWVLLESDFRTQFHFESC